MDYKCCSENPCVTTGTVTLSVALQNIINCLCEQKALIVELENKVNTLNTTVGDINSGLVKQVNTLNKQVCGLLTNRVQIQNALNCINGQLDSACSVTLSGDC